MSVDTRAALRELAKPLSLKLKYARARHDARSDIAQ
jgi:hypothetical protein